jgi:16S rRNA (guanine966-N2)-methyltransferase
MDPPYLKGFIEPTLETLVTTKVLKPDGLVVVEHEKTDKWDIPAGLELVKSRTYGITTLTIYRRA